MKRIENFLYNDIVLYSKGWYERTDGEDGIIKDLSYLFSKINTWAPKNEKEVAHFMMRAIDKLYEKMEIKFDAEYCGRWNNSFASFFDEINKRMLVYNVSFDRAVILWAMSIFFGLEKDKIKLNPPHFGKNEHFRMGQAFGGKLPISTTYTYMNNVAKKAFSD